MRRRGTAVWQGRGHAGAGPRPARYRQRAKAAEPFQCLSLRMRSLRKILLHPPNRAIERLVLLAEREADEVARRVALVEGADRNRGDAGLDRELLAKIRIVA